MHRLSVDHEKCKDCGECVVIMPGFNRMWEEGWIINSKDIRQEGLFVSAGRVKDGCPNGAIIFDRIL